MLTRYCVRCKTQFFPNSPKAKYCSGSCKVKDFRERKAIRKRIEVVLPDDEEIDIDLFSKSHEELAAKYAPTPVVDEPTPVPPTPEIKQPEPEEIEVDEPFTVDEIEKLKILMEIQKIKDEVIESGRNTEIGRRVWNMERKKKIDALLKLLNNE